MLDYFEGWFDGDAARLERGLRPELAKRSLGQGSSDPERLATLTALPMVEATAPGEGQREDPGDRRLEVEIEHLARPAIRRRGTRVDEQRHDGVPLHRVRAGEGLETFLYTLKVGPAGGRLPPSGPATTALCMLQSSRSFLDPCGSQPHCSPQTITGRA